MKRLKRIISLILAFVVLSADIAATLEAKEPETEIETGNVSDKFEAVYQKTGQYLYTKVKEPVVSSSGGEWAVIGLARSEYEAGESYYKKYAANVGNVVRSKKGILHERKYTEYSRVILALTSIGYDVTKVAGYNLLEPLADYQSVIWQGINGPIWALIALDSHNYQIPAAPAGAEQTTREKLLETILSAEAEGGGWALSGEGADVDMTAMAIQALAPYCGDDRVQAAVNRGLARISSMQDDNGGFGSYETANSESCSQVIVALCALGIDPKQDARVVKKGVSVLDALLSYEVKEGGFRHILSGGADGMATEQAYYAMTAYQRFRKNQRRLYDMTDVAITHVVESSGGSSGKKENPGTKRPGEKKNKKKNTKRNTKKNKKKKTESKKTNSQEEPGTSPAASGVSSSIPDRGTSGKQQESELEKGKKSITLEGKKYIVDEKAYAVIRKIQELGEEDTDAVLAVYREYQELSAEQKADVLNYKTFEEIAERIGKENHENQKTGIRAEGLEWYVNMTVKKQKETDDFYIRLQKSTGAGRLLALYEITLTNLLTQEKYVPEKEILFHIPMEKGWQAESGAADDRMMLFQCTKENQMEYPEYEIEEGGLSFSTSEVSYIGVLEVPEGAVQSLEEESEETAKETEHVRRTEEMEKEERPAPIWPWIAALCLALAALILGFLGSRGYLPSGRKEGEE